MALHFKFCSHPLKSLGFFAIDPGKSGNCVKHGLSTRRINLSAGPLAPDVKSQSTSNRMLKKLAGNDPIPPEKIFF